jgi:hypothetical protein
MVTSKQLPDDDLTTEEQKWVKELMSSQSINAINNDP